MKSASEPRRPLRRRVLFAGLGSSPWERKLQCKYSASVTRSVLLTSLMGKPRLSEQCRWGRAGACGGGLLSFKRLGTSLSAIIEYFSFPFHSSCLAVFRLRTAIECLDHFLFHSVVFQFLVPLSMLFTLRGMPCPVWKSLIYPSEFSSHITSSAKPFWPFQGNCLMHRQYLFLCSHCSL